MSRKTKRKGRIWLYVLVVGLLITAGAVAAGRYLRAPLREVVSGEIYRSGQPDGAAVRNAAEKLGVRSVLNLRGPRARQRWWEGDRQTTARFEASRLNLQREDLRFSSNALPPREEVLALVRFLDSSTKPLLIHCQMGVDRSGWASAIARLLRGESLDSALTELSVIRGHFCKRSECGLHQFFSTYETWLAETKRTHSSAAFRHWIGSYCPQPYDALVTASEPLPQSVNRGDELPFTIDVKNLSRSAWQSNAAENPIRLGARFIGPFAKPQEKPLDIFRTPNGPARDVYRAEASAPHRPGESRRIAFAIAAPTEPGTYYVQVDMVEEHVHWFSDLGRPGLVVPITVQ